MTNNDESSPRVRRVKVLNPPSDNVLHRITLRKAVSLIGRGAVDLVDVHEDEKFGPYPAPRVVRLKRPIDVPLPASPGVFSLEAVRQRDNYRCAYCGRSATTVDHVVPRSKGGESSWLNLVAACAPCNFRKGSQSLRESGMRLQWLPYEPRVDWYD